MTSLVGTRVLRGPDWEEGEADGGEGHLGTVVRLLGGGEVVVLWDMGNESTCNAGRDGKFSLRVLDSAPAGVHHPSVVCTECREDVICGVRWSCQTCIGCDLCTYCYADDKHSIGHEFTRIDYPGDTGLALPRRKMSVRCRAIGIFPGAKVTRGRDWSQRDEDGGPGSEGEVECFEKSGVEYQRNRVRVKWSNGGISSCRLGVNGQVDVSCIEEEVGPFYYRDHLALLDSTKVDLATKKATESSAPSNIQFGSCPATSQQNRPELGKREEPLVTAAESRTTVTQSGEGVSEKDQKQKEQKEEEKRKRKCAPNSRENRGTRSRGANNICTAGIG